LFDVSSFPAAVADGGSGTGLMITQAFVANSTKVYITGREKEALDTVGQKYFIDRGKIVAWVPRIEVEYNMFDKITWWVSPEISLMRMSRMDSVFL
jgi:hypothetical protein